MAELVYVDEQPAQAHQVLRSAVASDQFTRDQVVDVIPAANIDETIELILEHRCRVLITDYRLSEHKADVEYSGADLVRAFQSRFDRFPCFVTTAFAEEAVDEALDTNIIFPKSDFLGGDAIGDDERVPGLPFFVRVRKKIAEYETFVAHALEEWQRLAEKHAGGQSLTAQETERILTLDDTLESLHGKDVAIEGHLKRDALDPFQRMIESVEALIDRIEKEIE